MTGFYRIIPTLLLKDKGVVKTTKFKNPKYIGDPINIVKILNEKEADELCILNIDRSRHDDEPDYRHLEEIVSEAFMPVAYGGGIKKIGEVEQLFKIGIEKVIINTHLFGNFKFIKELSEIFGSQSIVACVDTKKNLFGKYSIYSNSGTKKTKINLDQYIDSIQKNGAGELILNSIDNDGMMKGYDIQIANMVNSKISIPFILLGGAGNKKDLISGINAGASGVSAGSLFVYQGKHKAVLVSYIKNEDLFF
ncbi:AglZ/HisF2 family acetamidino modification protein [SAR86 cluster bacterium]|nr:AglZ/HisF2 family acetamidino modification protein [SAR86 cluster bacterium]